MQLLIHSFSRPHGLISYNHVKLVESKSKEKIPDLKKSKSEFPKLLEYYSLTQNHI